MTEEEAKTKWCVMERMGRLAEPDSFSYRQSRCIGSACMQWRWASSNYSFDKLPELIEKGIKDPHGYCGLAGKP